MIHDTDQGASASQTGLSPAVEPASGLAGSAASIPGAGRPWSGGAWQLRVDGLYLRVVHGEHKTTVADSIVSEANAHLIAAAPDLYEALEHAATWFEEYAAHHYREAKNAPSYGEQHGREVKGKTNADRAKQLRVALAKARGVA